MTQTERIRLFEKEPIPTAVMRLSVPTVLAMLVTVLYSLADTYFVGLLNDPVQTAAVSLAAPVLLAFNAVNNLFGVGGSSMMSRALGRKDYETLHASSAFSFYGALACGVLFSLGCAVFRTPLLALIGADATTAAYTSAYMNWTVTLGAVPAILNVVLAYMIRSEGSSLIASIGTMSGCGLNILLDPIFIMPWGLGLGVEGAALATALSNLAAMLFFLVYLWLQKGRTMISISPRALHLKANIVGGVLSVGLPAAIQNLLNVLVSTLLNTLAAPYGAAALAAMGICKKVDMVPMYIAMGVGQGIMPLVSYNYASGDRLRMKSTVGFTLKTTLAFSVVCMVGLYAMPGQVVGLFIRDAQTVAYGTAFTRAFCLGLPFMCADFIIVGVLQSVGMGKESLVLAIARKLALELPFTYLLNRIAPLFGLPYAQTAAEAVVAAIAVWMLLRLYKTMEAEEKKKHKGDELL